MQVHAILDKLYARHRFGIKPGLERIIQLLNALGNPERDLRCIHIAGTNGKGSTASLCASVLQASGLRVGLYTSPHILRFNERIRVNGAMISDDDLVRYYLELEQAAEECEATFFEITTAIAFLAFKQAETDVCVIECGMGGRFDATNVVRPLVSVITSIDLDHQEYLGSTLETICLEKCGIIKPHIPCVSAEPREALRESIASEAAHHCAPYFYAVESTPIEHLTIDETLHSRLRIAGSDTDTLEILSPFSGEHQLRNLQCAVTALRLLPDDLRPTDPAIQRGVEGIAAATGLRGRIELVSLDPTVIVDVGHNPACIQMLVQTISASPHADKRFHCVYGQMADKDLDAMLETLRPIVDTLHAVQPDIARAMDKKTIAVRAREIGLKATEEPDISLCVQELVRQKVPILICGSFYVVEQALPAAEKALAHRNETDHNT